MAPKDGNAITFTEVDELNNPALTFIYSELQSGTTLKDEMGNGIRGRVDIAHLSGASTPWSVKSVQNLLIDIFLPAGYPHSVSEDYIPYQIFDSLQAFSSSIAGLLSSRAVLQGVGVGNADASPTSALLLHILQDTSGRIATIFFAHRVGTALEPECKMYRFAADIFNDLAMVLDCLSPMIPAGVSRVTVLSAAGVLRALCGVAGGSSKASLSAHFSKWGNLAEVNAKDSSQETVISLVGMLVGSLVVSHITSFTATWLTLLALLTLHLSLNYAAVRSVQMTTLNRQRANIVFSSMLSSDPDFAYLAANQWQSIHQQHLQTELGMREQNQRRLQIPSPADVSRQERIFDASGMLQWHGLPPGKEGPMAPETLGHCQIGVSLRDFMSSSSSSSSSSSPSVSTTSNSLKTALPLKALASLFNDENYILIFTTRSPSLGPRARISCKILLKQHATPKTHLKAWMHALLVARLLTRSPPSGEDKKKTGCGTTEMILSTLSRTLDFLNVSSRFEGYIDALGDKGWEVDVEGGVSALETRIGRRVVVS
ncbi:vitamin B6 photo-protection and homoeostasis-domain-containing protein [Aspergillus pseudoustus]|uniref:Vitamin B6 photo-protection and homoeostasis-domain-containing protein n=1 Tax=Aspergillus pseudoustus TaxID=1810923 RepID=A0ABR4KZX1_9EURO